MAGSKQYARVEGSRGCNNNCIYCTQWGFWGGLCRAKSPKRIVDEIEYMHNQYGSEFIWLTDDNLGFGGRMEQICEGLIERKLSNEITWFIQARSDDIVNKKDLLLKMRSAGCNTSLIWSRWEGHLCPDLLDGANGFNAWLFRTMKS